MVVKTGRVLVWAIALVASAFGYAEDPKQLVEQAVKTELAADQKDHSHWIYFETDAKPGRNVKQWVAETGDGTLTRVIELNGEPVPDAVQRKKMDSFLHDSGARSKQRKSQQHDDQQATEMLTLLPQAFIWSHAGEQGNLITLHFKPNPQFRPPNLEAKVFSAMEGDMAVDKDQLRIASLKGRMIQDVKIFGGLFGSLNAGGTFQVERRETGKGIWQITETHVHIQGHALIFKTISEQEDDVKSEFKLLPADSTMQQAERQLLDQKK